MDKEFKRGRELPGDGHLVEEEKKKMSQPDPYKAQRAYYERNKEEIKRKRRERYKKQKEKELEKSKERYANDEAYRERIKENMRKWVEDNREKFNEYQREYRKRKRKPGSD